MGNLAFRPEPVDREARDARKPTAPSAIVAALLVVLASSAAGCEEGAGRVGTRCSTSDDCSAELSCLQFTCRQGGTTSGGIGFARAADPPVDMGPRDMGPRDMGPMTTPDAGPIEIDMGPVGDDMGPTPDEDMGPTPDDMGPRDMGPGDMGASGGDSG